MVYLSSTVKKPFFCLVLAAFPCIAQKPAITAGSSNQGGLLKDDFAKSSLRLLKMIEGETGSFQMSPSGALLVPHATHEALDNLDVDAQSKS